MAEPKDILIIDDEKEFTDFMSTFLESRGFSVRIANNGRDGLKRIEEKEPDLLVLDVRMPGMGGIEFYTKICSPTKRAQYPVLILTGMEELTDYFREIRVDGFMTKPVVVDVFLAKIEELLKSRKEI